MNVLIILSEAYHAKYLRLQDWAIYIKGLGNPLSPEFVVILDDLDS